MNKYMSVLKNVDFIKYFFSINFITLAQSFVSISIIWLIYEETKNPLLIAIFGVLTQLPAIVFGPLISKVLDRFNIGRAMFLFLLLRASIFLIIFLLPFNDKISLSIIGLLIGLNSVIGIPLSAGGDIIIKEVCNDEQLVTANALMKELNISNIMQVPKLDKIVVNMGIGEAVSNPKLIETAMKELAQITGQQPVPRAARKSEAGFKLREGQKIGAKVTLRKEKMYEFLDRLISITLPRVRDFEGVSPKGFDGRGNYTLGLKEQIVFPEIEIDKVDKTLGLGITIVSTAQNDEEGRALLKAFGMPFAK